MCCMQMPHIGIRGEVHDVQEAAFPVVFPVPAMARAGGKAYRKIRSHPYLAIPLS